MKTSIISILVLRPIPSSLYCQGHFVLTFIAMCFAVNIVIDTIYVYGETSIRNRPLYSQSIFHFFYQVISFNFINTTILTIQSLKDNRTGNKERSWEKRKEKESKQENSLLCSHYCYPVKKCAEPSVST